MCVCKTPLFEQKREGHGGVRKTVKVSNVFEVLDERWNEFMLTVVVQNVDPDVRDVAPNGHHRCK